MRKKTKIILVLALIIAGIIVVSAMIANAKDKPAESAQLQSSAAYNPLEIEDYNDFEEVQRKVQAANDTKGKEIRDIHMGEDNILKKQAEQHHKVLHLCISCDIMNILRVNTLQYFSMFDDEFNNSHCDFEGCTEATKAALVSAANAGLVETHDLLAITFSRIKLWTDTGE